MDVPRTRTRPDMSKPHSLPCRTLALATLVLLAACGGGADSAGGSIDGPQVVRGMVGDTAVVRTVSGSEWGREARLVPEIRIGVLDGDPNYMFGSIRSFDVDPRGRVFVMDGQALELRVYDRDGNWIANWGRDGEGPGEFGQPDGGLTILSDGRVVVRDPGNARFQVFSSEGESVGQWPVIRGGFNTGNPFARQGDTILTPQVVNLDDGVPVREWRTGYVRVSPDGQIVDTMEIPDVGFEAARIEASLDGSTSVNSVPWTAGEQAEWHPDGWFIHGISDTYAFTLLRPGEPLRIERVIDPIPVQSGERDMRRALATRNMRGTDPNWRWNGPAIPDAKAPYDRIYAGRTGRIWVTRNGPAYEQVDSDFDPNDPEDIEENWGEDTLIDVFEKDGTFLGTITAPRDLSFYPRPVFDGDVVWGIARDEYGVQQVVRYRIDFGAPAAEG